MRGTFPSCVYLSAILNFLLTPLLASVSPTGHTEPGVSQTPTHDVTEVGQSTVLKCDPVSGHLSLYWYRQTPEKGMEFLISFYNKAPSEKADFFQERFSAAVHEDTRATLTIQPVQLGDSATYLCASSLATALQSHFLPVHELHSSSWVCRLSQPLSH